MSPQEDFEDAEIDGLSQGSWFGSCLRGFLVGTVLFIVGVIALSLSHPLPEHLPGVGKVEIVRNDAGAAPKPAQTQPEQPAQDSDQNAPSATSGDSAQTTESQPTTPTDKPAQPAAASDQQAQDQQTAAIEDQAPETAAAPAQPDQPAEAEAPTTQQSAQPAAPATPEQQAAAQPDQPAAAENNDLTGEADGALTEDGAGSAATAPTAPDQPAQPTTQPEVAQPEPQPDETPETDDQQVAALTPDQTPVPAPEIDLPGPALDVNARPFQSPDGAALLAVVLQDADGTTIATETLPLMTMPLTFAIPSGADNRSFAEQARAAGHEVLVQLPMAEEEGAEAGALAKGQAAASLSAAAARHMAELDMAIGATAPHQAPLLRDQDGMTAVMDPLSPHGFVWIDPRLGIGSAAKGVAALQDVIWSAGDRFIDGPPDEERIYQNLESAAALARRSGSSIVFLNASAEAQKALVRWGLNRGGKQVWFAPVSAVIKLRQAR